jgi:hypothetical protein
MVGRKTRTENVSFSKIIPSQFVNADEPPPPQNTAVTANRWMDGRTHALTLLIDAIRQFLTTALGQRGNNWLNFARK